jgi:hypothetical protein
LIFVACEIYIKLLCASFWGTGAFVCLSNSIPPISGEPDWRLYTTKVFGASIAGCALLLLEKILLHSISIKFHQAAYADRIKENKYSIQVLDKLGTSKRHGKKAKGSHSRTNSENCDIPSAYDLGYRSRQHSRCASLDKSEDSQLAGLGSSSCSPITLVDRSKDCPSPATRSRRSSYSRVISSDFMKGINRTLQGIAKEEGNLRDINSTEHAKQVAKSLFYQLQGSSDELIVEDFFPFFDTEDEAKAAFAIFDKDKNGSISKREIKEKTFYIYKERKDLHFAMRDFSQAVGKLDIIFLSIVVVVWVVIILSIFGADMVKNAVSFGSALVAISFIFGNSLKNLLENIIFLFITVSLKNY